MSETASTILHDLDRESAGGMMPFHAAPVNAIPAFIQITPIAPFNKLASVGEHDALDN
jgi:hypothetical protein